MAKTTYKKRVINGKEYYYFRIKEVNGKIKTLYAPTVKKLKEKIDLFNTGVFITKDEYGDFVKDWLYNTHLIDKKPATKAHYSFFFKKYIVNSPIYNIKLIDLNAIHIQKYYNDLINKGVTVNTIKGLNKIVLPSIRYAYDVNKIVKDFSRLIVLPKENRINDTKGITIFTEEEQKIFINAIKGHNLEMLFTTALFTGMRQGELLALTWEDIDLTNNTINVNKSYKYVTNVITNKYEDTISKPKTKSGIRVVPIPAFLSQKLKQHKIKQKELRLTCANLWSNNNLIFCNQFGKYLSSSNISKNLKNILKNNNLKPLRFHDLRHTYATRLFELGENPKTVSTILGHSNISITLDTYTHVLDDLKEKTVSKLDLLYNSQMA
ncbi:site-specific integrase [uncultured Clostridium sp.]|uniref:tyrosine-type recombinase/integrase n=1 Tax=uncultured Clostridium sp. TaxID=59620 RepID=UPI00262438F0|nr:site-specific integrase [uncultured Clostridium sp.]